MSNLRLVILAATMILAIGTAANAKPWTYTLPDDTAVLRPGAGPGFEAAQGACQACHSADYVLTQPPKKGQAFWDAEVTKMIKTYHAPIAEADAKAIADYLAQNY